MVMWCSPLKCRGQEKGQEDWDPHGTIYPSIQHKVIVHWVSRTYLSTNAATCSQREEKVARPQRCKRSIYLGRKKEFKRGWTLCFLKYKG